MCYNSTRIASGSSAQPKRRTLHAHLYALTVSSAAPQGGFFMPSRKRPAVCSTPGCPELTLAAHCAEHTTERGSTTERGLGHAHQQLRARWTPLVEGGLVGCARCERLIETGEAWDLGHDDFDRSVYTGPEHRSCNRRTAAHSRDAREGGHSSGGHDAPDAEAARSAAA